MCKYVYWQPAAGPDRPTGLNSKHRDCDSAHTVLTTYLLTSLKFNLMFYLSYLSTRQEGDVGPRIHMHAPPHIYSAAAGSMHAHAACMHAFHRWRRFEFSDPCPRTELILNQLNAVPEVIYIYREVGASSMPMSTSYTYDLLTSYLPYDRSKYCSS